MAESTTTEQIVREAPEIEATKLGLLKSAQALQAPTLPAYQIAGLSQDQLNALQLGYQGIGAYQPYLTSSGQYLGSAVDAYNTALSQGQAGLTGAQTAFGEYAQADLSPAQRYMTGAISQMGQAGPQFAQAISGIQGGVTGAQQAYEGIDLATSQRALNKAAQQMGAAGPQFGQAVTQTQAGIEQGRLAAQQPGYAEAGATLGQGVSALGGTAEAFTPTNVEQFMNPYQQKVIDESLRQINRQGKLARMGVQSQAVRTGSFGGSREGVQQAELGRGLAEAQNAAIVGGLSSGYQSALGQAQQAFEAQKQRQLAQAQGYQTAANLQGSLATQQGQLGLTAAQMAMQGGQQLAGIEAQRAQFAQNAARYGGDVAQLIAQQNLQRGQLGMSAAQMAMQGGQQLGSLEAQRAQAAQNIAQFQGTMGQQLGQQNLQQTQLGQNYAQNLATMAGQRFAMGSQAGAGLGSLATQYGTLANQQQAMGQQDTNFLYGLGSIQQQQRQRELDALRATQMQEAYQPYQQLAFLSDIYKGAPSSQMAFTSQLVPTPSPFQQGAGLITGIASTAAAAKTAGAL